MAKGGKRLNRTARNQLKGLAPGPSGIADRMLSLDAAAEWMARHNFTPEDIHDVLAVASFLLGEESYE